MTRILLPDGSTHELPATGPVDPSVCPLSDVTGREAPVLLIQEHRAREAMAEVGVEGPLLINHHQPVTVVGDEVRYLVYSRRYLGACRGRWAAVSRERRTRIGYTANNNTPDSLKRLRVLLEWQERHPEDRAAVRLITYGTRGSTRKYFDDEYLRWLGGLQHSLVTDGLNRKGNQLVWSYRFVDSVLMGAIPIVETMTPLYEEFECFRMSDAEYPPYYSEEMALRNFAKAQKLFTLKPEMLVIPEPYPPT